MGAGQGFYHIWEEEEEEEEKKTAGGAAEGERAKIFRIVND